MSQQPPNGLMCQQCPYKQEAERRRSASIVGVAVDSASTNIPMQANAQIAAFLRGLEEYKNEGRDMVMVDPIIEQVRQLLHG